MNTSNIKRYAPKARTAFIAAMTKRAALFGIRESSIPSQGIEPLEQKGDLALIGDRPFPASIIRPRAALVKKVEQMGFAQAMEQAAYSWFNRLCAIRYMELKGYLDHGRRVLSHPDHPGGFQILDECLDFELEGLDKQRIAELKLDGTKDEELYHELLLAQCHALHQAMPFLFEAVDDALELLLPNNLTKTDSLIRELVEAIPEENWGNVEIIGWLYQFYISEKKDQVIGKVVKSEDIPAATQLFTPNWIVQYLVQNSVGRQWLQTYPDSPLKKKMPYYIEPAEQTPEVWDQLAAITPDNIDPMTIKVLDPACGSGHILVEAYKVLKAIYEERGYRSRDIPQLILQHNLYGLDIDDRAGQLAGFALMMLAREDDRRIFTREIQLNVLSMQESRHVDFDKQWKALNLTSEWRLGQSQSLFESEQRDLSSASADNRYQFLQNILARFIQAKTLGSLIEVPAEDAKQLSELLVQLRQLARDGDVMQKPASEQLIPYVQQAWLLAQRYDAVVANPPYLGSNNFNATLKNELKRNGYKITRTDLCVVFIQRLLRLCNPDKDVSMVTMRSWMFTDSYEDFRLSIINETTIKSLIHLGSGAFESIGGEIVSTTMFTFGNGYKKRYISNFKQLSDANGNSKESEFFNSQNNYTLVQSELTRVKSQPFVFWKGDFLAKLYEKNLPIGEYCSIREGIHTGDNPTYIRSWWEVSSRKTLRTAESISDIDDFDAKWIPYNKGGGCYRWYGYYEFVLAFDKRSREEMAKLKSHVRPSQNLYFLEGATWSDIGTKGFGVKYYPKGFLFDQKGPACVSKNIYHLISALNSKTFTHIAETLMPTVTYRCGTVSEIPLPLVTDESTPKRITEEAISIAKSDYDNQELSFDFKRHPISGGARSIFESLANFRSISNRKTEQLIELEEENNLFWSNAYGLSGEINSKVIAGDLTLFSNLPYRYRGAIEKGTSLEEVEGQYRSELLVEIISYFIGCVMGRYSLDCEGLVYAHVGNLDFAELIAAGAYKTFPADSDGILPLTDQEWFTDDASNRFREFVRIVWGEEHLQENLNFVAESLCLQAIKPKRGESALDTIRRYLSIQFFKDHLKTYKKRPIYWLFSSGKHKAFECLVYLHRYNEVTLARMRTEYVIPLTAKLNTYANKLEQDINASTSTAERKALEKQLTTLHNQQAELSTFDEKLRHYADLRISLDLDNGVKVNYGRFGDLLAEVKTVTGEKA